MIQQDAQAEPQGNYIFVYLNVDQQIQWNLYNPGLSRTDIISVHKSRFANI